MAYSAAILGCAGYSGQETLDRVLAHPGLELVALGSDSLAGESAAALDPRLNGSLPAFVPNDEAAASGADVLFLCLDNDAAAAFEPPPDTVVLDLAGAHRLVDEESARRWYGVAPGSWCYGLPELYPADAPQLARVQGTDAAEIGAFTDTETGAAIVICALDNLGKGAAGQAVQNANRALDLDETAGLRLSGVLV